jgi:succinate-semialdehyde dehydrogenase/glutarate-semialdehyde dehydrogenase
MALYREETFGPVVAVYRISSAAEAVAACNDSAYGLHASIYSKDVSRARRLAAQIQTGTVGINENHKVAWASMRAAQGGFKQSGIGRRHGREGITKYTQTQNISAQHVFPLSTTRLLPPKRWDWFFNIVLRVMQRVPGLR